MGQGAVGQVDQVMARGLLSFALGYALAQAINHMMGFQ